MPALDGGCAQGAFGRAGFASFPGLLTCVQLPPSRLAAGGLAPNEGSQLMFKVTPNPPDTDPVSPYELDPNKLNEAAERALNFHFPSTADIKATPRTPSTLFTVDPQATTETLMVYLVETLASVDVMVHQLVDHLEGESRSALLGISNSIMVAEIMANRVLDQVDPPE
jgi:hypothetical protein